MYRILVVDDEPAAIKHICTIISLKCPQFEVANTAEHGQEALKLIEADTPDVLITDVKMPVMDGIALTEKVKARYPQVLSLVVSGYQEFEYAKAAIKSGVCDYLLKPMKPSALENALNSLEGRLDEIYARKRNLIMKSLCEKISLNQNEFKRYFPAGRYYGAIVRRNGLPRRFSGTMGIEIFSGKDEKIYLYGRDEMESLFLCPEDILIYKSFYQVISETVKREEKNASYVTGVIKETPFSIEKAGEICEELYQTLDSSLIVGESQILIIEEKKELEEEKEVKGFEQLELFIQQKQREKIIEEVGILFENWKQTRKSQMYVEARVRYLLILLDKFKLLSESERSIERILDEIFYYAADMDEVSDSIRGTFIQTIKKEQLSTRIDTAEFFKKIETFIHQHIADDLSIQILCREFGLSQTYLSKIFRKYSGCSFSKYLTLARIAYAREMMSDKELRYVKEIAARVGYNDQFYFSRIFTSVVGICPSDYMEQIQKEDKYE